MKSNFWRSTAIFVLGAFLLTPAITTAKDGCVQRSESTADEGDFLACKLEATESNLKKKVAQLIAIVSKTNFWFASNETGKRNRVEVISGIREADKLWQKMTSIECRTLLGTQYVGGSGQDNYVLKCLISRTEDRVKAIELDETYKDYWAR